MVSDLTVPAVSSLHDEQVSLLRHDGREHGVALKGARVVDVQPKLGLGRLGLGLARCGTGRCLGYVLRRSCLDLESHDSERREGEYQNRGQAISTDAQFHDVVAPTQVPGP